MNNMRWLFPAFLLLSSIPAAQAAGTLQGNLGIQIIIGPGCTVNNSSSAAGTNTFGSISFGTYPSLANAIIGQSVGASAGSSFGINCATGTTYSVALNSGTAATGNQRRMSGGGDFIPYNLYKEAARTNLWGDNSNGATPLTGTGSGANQEIVVYGRVPSQVTTPPAATYTDTVLVTVTW